MFRNKLLRTVAATAALLAMQSQTMAVMAADGYAPGREHQLRTAEKIELLRHKVKYVFVIFAENRSFDSYFGTFPGVNGLFSAPPGFTPA